MIYTVSFHTTLKCAARDARRSIIDALSTQVIDKTMVKIYAWYDNECGYSKRMAELCHIVAAKFIAGVEPTFKYE